MPAMREAGEMGGECVCARMRVRLVFEGVCVCVLNVVELVHLPHQSHHRRRLRVITNVMEHCYREIAIMGQVA